MSEFRSFSLMRIKILIKIIFHQRLMLPIHSTTFPQTLMKPGISFSLCSFYPLHAVGLPVVPGKVFHLFSGWEEVLPGWRSVLGTDALWSGTSGTHEKPSLWWWCRSAHRYSLLLCSISLVNVMLFFFLNVVSCFIFDLILAPWCMPGVSNPFLLWGN